MQQIDPSNDAATLKFLEVGKQKQPKLLWGKGKKTLNILKLLSQALHKKHFVALEVEEFKIRFFPSVEEEQILQCDVFKPNSMSISPQKTTIIAFWGKQTPSSKLQKWNLMWKDIKFGQVVLLFAKFLFAVLLFPFRSSKRNQPDLFVSFCHTSSRNVPRKGQNPSKPSHLSKFHLRSLKQPNGSYNHHWLTHKHRCFWSPSARTQLFVLVGGYGWFFRTSTHGTLLVDWSFCNHTLTLYDPCCACKSPSKINLIHYSAHDSSIHGFVIEFIFHNRYFLRSTPWLDAFSKPCRISWYFCAELSFDHALDRLNQTKDFMAPVLHTLMFPVSYCSPLSCSIYITSCCYRDVQNPLRTNTYFLLSGAAVASASSQLTYDPHWLVVRPPTLFDIHFTQPF